MKLIQRISGMLGIFFPSNTIKVKDDDFSECDFFSQTRPVISVRLDFCLLKIFKFEISD